MTREEWYAQGKALFGEDMMQWKFLCPACKHIASTQDYKDAGAPEGAVAFSCVGRWLPVRSEAFSGEPGPCNYSGGGLIKYNPIKIDGEENVFAFADNTEVSIG